MALFTPQNIPQYNGNDLQGTVQQLLTAYKALTEQLTYVLQNIDDDNGAASSGDIAELNDKMISAVSNASNAFSNASAALEAAQNAYQTAKQARSISEQAEATAEATKQDASEARSAAASAQSSAASAQTAAETAKQSASAAQTAANTAEEKASAAVETANNAAASIPVLSNSVTSSSSTTAATSKAVKKAYDMAADAIGGTAQPFNSVKSSYQSTLVHFNDGATTVGSNITVPKWSQGILVTAGGADGVLMAVTTDAHLAVAFRNNGSWASGRII